MSHAGFVFPLPQQFCAEIADELPPSRHLDGDDLQAVLAEAFDRLHALETTRRPIDA